MGRETILEERENQRAETLRLIELSGPDQEKEFYFIASSAAHSLGITLDILRSNNRKRVIVEARQLCFFYLRKRGFTFERIADYFYKNHTTVWHGLNNVDNLIKTDDLSFYLLEKKFMSHITNEIEGNKETDTNWTKVRIFNAIRLPRTRLEKYTRVIYEVAINEGIERTEKVVLCFHKSGTKKLHGEVFMQGKGKIIEGVEVVSIVRDLWILNKYKPKTK